MNGDDESFFSLAYRWLFAAGFFIAIAMAAIGTLAALFFLVTDRSVFSPFDDERINRECTTIVKSDGSSLDTCDYLNP
jgi:hypothetical protein